jgi:hypothetical protein
VSPKTTVVGVQAPHKPQAPAPAAVDDFWDAAPEPARAASPEATQPLPAAVSPAVPAAPPAATPSPVSPPVAAGVALSAVDLRLIMREMIDQALAPLQMRLAELERRPRAPSAPAFVPSPSPAAQMPAVAPVAPAAPAAPPVHAHAPPAAYASAMAAPTPGPAAPRSLLVAQPPLLDVKAIERDVSLDIDVSGFDGGKRKRRMMVLFFVAVLALFGGLFALLADSYTPHH